MLAEESETNEETDEESEIDEAADEEVDEEVDEERDLETDEESDESPFYFLIETRLNEQMAGSDRPAECCICRQEVELGKIVTELGCGHWFDTECILAWLNECRNWPLCRRTVEEEVVWREWEWYSI